MTKRSRRNHSPAFKAKVALGTLREDKTLAELAQQYDAHPKQITEWRKRLVASSAETFEGKGDRPERTNCQSALRGCSISRPYDDGGGR